MKKNTGIAIAAVAALGCATLIGAVVKHLVDGLERDCDFDCENCDCCDCQPDCGCEKAEEPAVAEEKTEQVEETVEEIEKIEESAEASVASEEVEIKVEE